MSDRKWNIVISAPFEGFAPAYWANSYPNFGKKNMAGAMQYVDISDPVKLTQGPGLSSLTNGTDASAVTTLIDHILDVPSSNNVTWGIGGSKLYKISSSTVTSDANFPHTIDKAVVTGEDGESVVYLNDFLYYFYNHSGSAGDIGRLTVSTNTFDDDWGSTVPTGAAALTNNPHPAILGGNGRIYFGNGAYVGQYIPSSNTISTTELALPSDCKVVDLVYERDLVWIATNAPNITTSNTNRGIIYAWNATASTFQEPIIEVPGRIGKIISKNGLIYVFYQDVSSTGGYKLGFINGDSIQEITNFSGSLPVFGQVTHYKNMLAFVSSGEVYLYGAVHIQVPIGLSKYMDCGHATGGALANPFGSLMAASNTGGSYRLAKESGLDTNAHWKSLMFDVATSKIDTITIHYEPTSANARVDITIDYDRGKTTGFSVGSISHTSDSALIKKVFKPALKVNDFRIILDWANGSATNGLGIRKIEVEGHQIEEN